MREARNIVVCRWLLIASVLCAEFAARADYMFTWHYIYPQFQKFQGSFELTDAEMQVGATFNSDLFRNSISISSLDGVYFNAKDPNWSDTSGSFSPNFQLFMNLHDSSHTISL